MHVFLSFLCPKSLTCSTWSVTVIKSKEVNSLRTPSNLFQATHDHFGNGEGYPQEWRISAALDSLGHFTPMDPGLRTDPGRRKKEWWAFLNWHPVSASLPPPCPVALCYESTALFSKAMSYLRSSLDPRGRRTHPLVLDPPSPCWTKRVHQRGQRGPVSFSRRSRLLQARGIPDFCRRHVNCLKMETCQTLKYSSVRSSVSICTTHRLQRFFFLCKVVRYGPKTCRGEWDGSNKWQ